MELGDFPTHEPDESQLLTALRGGSEAAFEHLVKANRARLVAVARRILPEEQDAKDAVQDAFIAAFRSIQHFKGESRLSTWLHRVAVNACLLRLRTRRRRPEHSLGDAHWEALAAPQSANAEQCLQERDDIQRVRSALETLPERHRRILVLRDLEERNTRETAAALSISPGAVKTRLHRARLALRNVLEAA